MRTLWDLICDRPNEEWGVYDLSSNMAISIHDIFLNPNGPPGRTEPWEWDLDFIAIREDVTWEMITSDKNPWKDDFIFNKNPNITWKNIIGSPERNWKPEEISSKPNITWKIMLNNPYGPYNDHEWQWDSECVLFNPNITLKILKEDIYTLNTDFKWRKSWEHMVSALSYAASLLDISANMDLNWCWNSISFRNDLTWSFIKKAADNNKDLNWYGISESTAITWDIIIANINYRWEWLFISQNPNITFDIIKNNPNKSIDGKCPQWSSIDIFRNPNATLNWTNSCFDWMDSQSYQLFHYCIFLSPNITIKNIINNPDIKVDYKTLSCNNMDYTFSSNYYRKKLANKTSALIKDELENRVYHPSQHPSNYLSIDEAKIHPLFHFTPKEVKSYYVNQFT